MSDDQEQQIAITNMVGVIGEGVHIEPPPASVEGPNMSKEEALGLIGEGAPPEPEAGPLVEQSAPVESYPVDSDLWAPVNAAFCELCKRYGLPKGHQSVAFDRQTGSFVVRDRPVE